MKVKFDNKIENGNGECVKETTTDHFTIQELWFLQDCVLVFTHEIFNQSFTNFSMLLLMQNGGQVRYWRFSLSLAAVMVLERLKNGLSSYVHIMIKLMNSSTQAF